jgi:hypothetical protein
VDPMMVRVVTAEGHERIEDYLYRSGDVNSEV